MGIARLAFLACLALGTVLPWLNALPPIVDLPQHAGQVIHLDHLLRGSSAWDGLLRLNVLTPYLVAYLAGLALHQVMPIEAALKLLLSVGYVLMVGMLVLLRRRLGGDRRLDWLFLPSFFGFSYSWGLLPFLLGAPACLAVLLAGHRYAERVSLGRGAALLALGLLAFFSHGLMFLLGCALAGLFLLPGLLRRREPLVALWPFLALGALALFYSFTADLPARFDEHGTPSLALAEGLRTRYGSTWQRAGEFLVYPLGTISGLEFAPLTLALMAVPFLLGARINRHRLDRLVLFGAILVIWAAVPNTAMQTGFLYERFSLFILPFYALMFEPGRSAPRRAQGAALAGLALCGLFLGITVTRQLRFEEEARDFRALLAQAPAGGLALSLVFDRASPALDSRDVYLHFPAWYQARGGGFVEFNFAFFLPGIVRYRRGAEPALPAAVDISPERFEGERHGAARYDLWFTRGATPERLAHAAGPRCALERVAREGRWELFRGCPDPAQRPAPAEALSWRGGAPRPGTMMR
jgi:hypothetical protein